MCAATQLVLPITTAPPRDAVYPNPLAPGEGDIDLVGLIRLLDRIGSEAPITVEVFSDSLVERYSAHELAIHLSEYRDRLEKERPIILRR